MQVAITGAAGEVGRVIRDAFEPENRTLLTHSEHGDLDSEVLDATDQSAFDDAIDGADALVHLAWDSVRQDAWEEGEAENIEMTFNAFEAAVEAGIDRVVVASSNHVFGMYNRDDPGEFESVVADPTTAVHPDTVPRPDSVYGATKLAVEGLCRYYADLHGLDVCIVRIGWLMDRDELQETTDYAPDRHRFARAMWLSPRDCRALFEAAVEIDLDHSPVVAHGVSRNSDRFMSLTETMQLLDYRPQDDAAAVLDE